MKIKGLLVLVLFAPFFVLAEKPLLTEREFTAKYVEYLQSNNPDSEFEILSSLNIQAEDVNGYELKVYLGNAYDAYKSGAKSIESVFADFSDVIESQKEIFSNTSVKSIFPVLKPREYIETARQQLKEAGYDKEALPFYYEKLNDDIYQMYVFDSKDSMSFVSPEDVDEYGIESSIAEIAKKNMENYYGSLGAQIGEMDTQGNGRIYLFSADENYEASILVAFDYLESTNLPSDREWVVYVPARSIALIVDSNDSQAIQLASYLAVQGYNELAYAISPFGYIKKDGSWIRFKS